MAAEEPADLVLFNGIVYAADARQSEFRALAVADGRIVYRGPDKGAQKWIGPDTEWIDLKGKMVIPGLHDAHLHPFMGAVDMMECSLSGMTRLDEYLDKVRLWAKEHADKGYIRGSGWLYTSFGVRGPDKIDLDRIVADRPVLLKAIDGHSAWVNSKALELAGISSYTADPPGGRIERDPASGEPTGTLREWTAMQLVEDRLPQWGGEDLIHAFRSFLQLAARSGLTAVHDAMASAEHLAAYLAVEERKELALRVSASLLCVPEMEGSFLDDLIQLRRCHETSPVAVRSCKIFIDGVIEGHTAFLLSSYDDRPDFKGNALWKWEDFKMTVAALDRAGFQIHIHAVGDAAVRMALDGFEHAAQVNGRRDSRHQIAHLDLISAEDISRFRSLGVIANFQPLWFFDEAGSDDMDKRLLGSDRSRRLYPMESVFDSRAMITCGSDWPVGAEFISLNPLDSIKAGLLGLAGASRKNNANPSRNRIDIKTMLDFYTRNAAYAAFQEEKIGSIEVGKLADLAVLDRNLFVTPVAELDRVKVMLTLLEGKVTYRDLALA